MSSPRHSADEAHPDPPSPSPPPPPPSPTAGPTPADVAGSSTSQSSVGHVGSTSGRSRFYDALRRIGFPHPPVPPPAPPVETATASESDNDASSSSRTAAAPDPAGISSGGASESPATTTAPTQQNSSSGPEVPSVPMVDGAAVPPAPELTLAPESQPTAGSDGSLAQGTPPPTSAPSADMPFLGLDIMLDANGGPPPTRDEMETLMRSLFGPNVVMPPQPIGPTLVGGQTAVPSIQAIPPAGMFAGTGSQPTGADTREQTGSDNGQVPVAPTPLAANVQPEGDGAVPVAHQDGLPAPAGNRPPPAPGALGQLINQFISQLVAQHRTATAGTGAPSIGTMPIIISFTFGSPGAMARGLNDDKVPDPERAEELLSALSRPSAELIERLDHALRCEEADAGVETMEQSGANCSVCMETLLPPAAGTVGSDGADGEVVSLPCGHAFHDSCLRPWLETNTNCPSCRFDLDPLSTTLRPHRQTPGRATAAPSPSPAEAGAIPAASGANAQGRGHPYSRPLTRPGTPTAVPPRSASAPPQPQPPRRYVLPPGRQTLLERVIHLERAHHIRCSLALCSHADPDLPSPERRTIALAVGTQPGPDGFVWLACEHRFHPDCLRVACRVRGDREIVDATGRRLVGCNVKGCHGEGWVEAADWEDDADMIDEVATQSNTALPSVTSVMEVDAA